MHMHLVGRHKRALTLPYPYVDVPPPLDPNLCSVPRLISNAKAQNDRRCCLQDPRKTSLRCMQSTQGPLFQHHAMCWVHRDWHLMYVQQATRHPRPAEAQGEDYPTYRRIPTAPRRAHYAHDTRCATNASCDGHRC